MEQYLPNELISDIVSRLPVDDLRNVKSVDVRHRSHAVPLLHQKATSLREHDMQLYEKLTMFANWYHSGSGFRFDSEDYEEMLEEELEDMEGDIAVDIDSDSDGEDDRDILTPSEQYDCYVKQKDMLIETGVLNDKLETDETALRRVLSERFQFFKTIEMVHMDRDGRWYQYPYEWYNGKRKSIKLKDLKDFPRPLSQKKNIKVVSPFDEVHICEYPTLGDVLLAQRALSADDTRCVSKYRIEKEAGDILKIGVEIDNYST